MYLKQKRTIAIISLLGLFLPAALSANTTYTYTSSSVNVSFQTTLNPDSLAPGTDITSSLVGGSFSMDYPPPSQDEAGFPLADHSFMLSSLAIGTNSVGDITSWNIAGTEFASYPAFPGESPTDFYCNYSVSFTAAGGSGPLSLDNDAGFCPGSANAVATGSWTPYLDPGNPSTGTPEPLSSALLGSGLIGVAALAVRRKHLTA